MKKICYLTLFIVILIACESEKDTVYTNSGNPQLKIVYKGQLYESPNDIEPYLTETSSLFNDYSENENLDYLFDSEQELLEFVKKNYGNETSAFLNKHFSEESSNSINAEAKTSADWNDFSLQFYDTYCNTSNLLCYLDPYFFPQGQINDISAGGCGYNARSFGIGVPSNAKMSITYYRNTNCMPEFNSKCFPSYRTVLFNPGSYCVDVMLGSCLSSGPAIIKSYARSVKWSCTRTI